MNRKNRKEKEQNTDVSKQICVHKTQNTLLEFNSFLRMAEPKDFWHLHEDIASDYSGSGLLWLTTAKKTASAFMQI